MYHNSIFINCQIALISCLIRWQAAKRRGEEEGSWASRKIKGPPNAGKKKVHWGRDRFLGLRYSFFDLVGSSIWMPLNYSWLLLYSVQKRTSKVFVLSISFFPYICNCAILYFIIRALPGQRPFWITAWQNKNLTTFIRSFLFPSVLLSPANIKLGDRPCEQTHTTPFTKRMVYGTTI